MFGKILTAATSFALSACVVANATDIDTLKERAQKGDAQAQYELGLLYQKGESSLKADTQSAIDWLKDSAKTGLEKADKSLNNLYANRDNIADMLQDKADKAGELFDQGVTAGKDLWNQMMNSGVAKDTEKAVEWITKAASAGNAAAQNKLGEMYLNGTGVQKDKQAAASWFKKACDNGNADGCSNYRKSTERSF